MSGFFNKLGKKMDELVDTASETVSEVKNKVMREKRYTFKLGEHVNLNGTGDQILEQLEVLGYLKEDKDD